MLYSYSVFMYLFYSL